jgi:hypothetical protein
LSAFSSTLGTLHPGVDFKPVRQTISNAFEQTAGVSGHLEALPHGEFMLKWVVHIDGGASNDGTTPDDSTTEGLSTSCEDDDNEGDHAAMVYEALQVFRTSRLASDVAEGFAADVDSGRAAQAMLAMAPRLSDDDLAVTGEFLSIAVADGLVSLDDLGTAMVNAVHNSWDVHASGTAEKTLLSLFDLPLPRQVAGLNTLAAQMGSDERRALHRIVSLGSRCVFEIAIRTPGAAAVCVPPPRRDVQTCATLFDGPF